MNYLSPLLLKALEFAAVAHAGQFRKSFDHVPYFSHPAAVALVLAKAGCAEPVIIAGALHDIIEDTKISAQEIEREFGPEVLAIVQGVTEDKRLPWLEQKESYIRNLRTAPIESRMVSAADLLANRVSLLRAFQSGVNPWESFSKDPARYAYAQIKLDTERLAAISADVDLPFIPELKEAVSHLEQLTKEAYPTHG